MVFQVESAEIPGGVQVELYKITINSFSGGISRNSRWNPRWKVRGGEGFQIE